MTAGPSKKYGNNVIYFSRRFRVSERAQSNPVSVKNSIHIEEASQMFRCTRHRRRANGSRRDEESPEPKRV